MCLSTAYLHVQVDIFHPLSSLEWKECSELTPTNINWYSHSVNLKDKLYISRGFSFKVDRRSAARLYIYTPACDTWETIDTPVYDFVLTTYRSRLVLVGGKEYVGKYDEGRLSAELYTLGEGDQWQNTLPPMDKACLKNASAVSHGDNLLVFDGTHNEIKVYNGCQWTKAQYLPESLPVLKATLFNSNVCVIGGVHYRMKVYLASLDSLIANCEPSDASQSSPVWKQLPSVPDSFCYPIVLGSKLTIISNSTIHAYVQSTHSWVNVASMPPATSGTGSLAIVLPSKELMLIQERKLSKAVITCKNVLQYNIYTGYVTTYILYSRLSMNFKLHQV